MLPTELLLDHRRSDDSTLLDALRDHDPLALAEAYHRTVSAANACARRLLSSPAQIETLLRTVYRQLWEDPPRDVPLEGWVRACCYALGTGDLRERGVAPASPSLTTLLPDLPAPTVRYLDAAERALGELDERDRTVLLLAHDRGVAAATQGGDAAAALDRSLRALAGPEPSNADATLLRDDPCSDVQGMGDWVLGLSSQRQAAELEALVASRPGCAVLARTLRRGRRRLEGLPPTADMGHRILVTVLTATAESKPIDHAPPVRKVPQPAPADPSDLTDPSDITTSELQLTEQHEAPRATAAQRSEAEPSRRPSDGDTVTSTEWQSGESMSAVATRDPARPRVVRLPNDEDTDGFQSLQRPDPYGQLARLDDDIEQRLRTDVDASLGTEEVADYESFYLEEELITRPSTGHRVLVAIGYMLPILLGGVLGLYIADLLFTLNR